MTGISNGRLGMMLLVGTETILFSSFIGAYIVLRGAAASWPPFGTPRLTLDLSSVNTALLVFSSIQVWRRRIGLTFVLGSLFLVLQAFEFHRLYARGLTLQTGTYGALFYTLVTCHGLHVLGGLAILAVALRKTAWTEYAELYWHFVTGVWLVLFSVLYIV